MKTEIKALFLVILILGFAACTKKGEEFADSSVREKTHEDQYILNNWELPDIEKKYEGVSEDDDYFKVMSISIDGDCIWRIARIFNQNKNATGFLIQRASEPYNKWQSAVIRDKDFFDDHEVLPICFSVPRNGLTYLFYQFGFQTKEEKYGYGRWSFEKGFEGGCEILDKSINRDAITARCWRECEDGRLLGVDGTRITIWSESFLTKEKINTGNVFNNVFETHESHELAWFGELEGRKGVYLLGENTPLLLESDQIEIPSTGMACQADNGQFYFTDKSSVWLYDGGEVSRKTSLQKQGFSCDELLAFSADQGNNLVLVTEKDQKYFVWKLMNEQGKNMLDNQITIAVGYIDPWLRDRVTTFNRVQRDYQIVFRLKDENIDFEDFEKRLLTEMSTGEGPDLLYNVLSVGTKKSLVAKGMFSDLRACVTNENDYFDGVISTDSNPIYNMPISFQPWTLLVGERVAKEMESCTTEELMTAIIKSDAQFFSRGMDGIDIVNLLALKGTADTRIIDIEKKECHFQGELFMRILEFAKKYQDTDPQAEKADYFQQGRSAVEELFLGDAYAIIWAETLTGGSMHFVGYPSPDGGYTFCNDSDIMVNASSRHLDGAFHFVEFLLSDESQNKLAEMHLSTSSVVSYPVKESSMKWFLQELQNKKNEDGVTVERDGTVYREAPLSAKQAETFRELMDHLKVEDERLYVIRGIVNEELAGYFSGERTADEVTRIMDQRVKLYLSE